MIRSWSLLLKLQRDLCSNGGGLLLHIREDIPSRLLTEYKPLENVEKKISKRKNASLLVV